MLLSLQGLSSHSTAGIVADFLVTVELGGKKKCAHRCFAAGEQHLLAFLWYGLFAHAGVLDQSESSAVLRLCLARR